jgi:hypothetical protein
VVTAADAARWLFIAAAILGAIVFQRVVSGDRSSAIVLVGIAQAGAWLWAPSAARSPATGRRWITSLLGLALSGYFLLTPASYVVGSFTVVVDAPETVDITTFSAGSAMVAAIAGLALILAFRAHTRVLAATHDDARRIAWLSMLAEAGAVGTVALLPVAAGAGLAAPAAYRGLLLLCGAGAAAAVVGAWHLVHLRAGIAAIVTGLIAPMLVAVCPLVGPAPSGNASLFFSAVIVLLPLAAAATWLSVARLTSTRRRLVDAIVVAAGIALAALGSRDVVLPADIVDAWLGDPQRAALAIAAIVARAAYLAAVAGLLHRASRSMPTIVPVARLRA